MRKSPTENPAQFNQRRMLVLDFVLKAANLIHLVTKQAYEKINLVVCHAYDERVSMKSLGTIPRQQRQAEVFDYFEEY
jgi:hypothetical protein